MFGVGVFISATPARVCDCADSGVTDISRCLPALKAMAECGVLLLVHGEVTDPEVDMFDREAVFIETKLVRATGRSAVTAAADLG